MLNVHTLTAANAGIWSSEEEFIKIFIYYKYVLYVRRKLSKLSLFLEKEESAISIVWHRFFPHFPLLINFILLTPLMCDLLFDVSHNSICQVSGNFLAKCRSYGIERQLKELGNIFVMLRLHSLRATVITTRWRSFFMSNSPLSHLRRK